MDNGEGHCSGHVQEAPLGQPEPGGGEQLVGQMAGTGGENIGEFGQSCPFGGGPGERGGGILDDQQAPPARAGDCGQPTGDDPRSTRTFPGPGPESVPRRGDPVPVFTLSLSPDRVVFGKTPGQEFLYDMEAS